MKKIIFYPLFAVVVSFLLLTACSDSDVVDATDNLDLVRQTATEFLQQNGITIDPSRGEAGVARGVYFIAFPEKLGERECYLVGYPVPEELVPLVGRMSPWVYVSLDGKTGLGYGMGY